MSSCRDAEVIKLANRVLRGLGGAGVFACCCSLTPTIWAQPVSTFVDSPLSAGARLSPNVTELVVSPSITEQLTAATSFVVSNFPLDGEQRVSLSLKRMNLFTAGARFISASSEGETPLNPPDILLLSGEVDGEAGSLAFLSVNGSQVNGFVQHAGKNFIISSGIDGAHAPVIYATADVTGAELQIIAPVCGAEDLPEYQAALDAYRPTPERANDAPDHPDRIARIAIDADWEFVRAFPSQPDALAYITTLLGAVSSIYERELNLRIQIPFVRLAENENDYWTEAGAQAQLTQFRLYWQQHSSDADRNAAHLLSGRALTGAGGTAYLNGLCSDLGYGISGYLNGFFPMPLTSNQPQNWDVYVVAHELGHNFGAPHTHQMTPPIDFCGLGDCSNAASGTIMSYCHTCSGSLSNIALTFHQRIINERIAPFLNIVQCPLIAPSACIADLNNNGIVDGSDLSGLLEGFSLGFVTPYTHGDINGNSIVNGADLSVFLREFGRRCD